ncbi:ABC transporter F family member 4 isoform X2 [Antennarius striatus]|uniref:ABC transporter F family member 4 isoform X2 n=1 Tax=Antennarius striatus TaxID=241820 RepID=UPI0035B01979
MEEDIMTTTLEHEDAKISKSSDVMSNTPVKRRRGKSQGSKKLKVGVTDVHLMELVSDISNGGCMLPKLSASKPKEQQITEDSVADDSVQSPQGSPKCSENQDSEEDVPKTDHITRKRGRPKKSVKKSAAKNLQNGSSNSPKKPKGHPKGAQKRTSESLTSGEENESSSVTPRKRGRPKGSLNKVSKLESELASEWVAEAVRSLNSLKRVKVRPRQLEVSNTGASTRDRLNGVKRGRGRPRKLQQESGDEQELNSDGSPPVKRGRGRPKGSLNKKHAKASQAWTVHVPSTKKKRGRPTKQPAKRGRPRKYPLPSPEELKKPKVWKPLGRPRKYPRAEPPEGGPTAPRRSRGRPRKTESKKGAHFRKGLTTPSSPSNSNDGSLRKRGSPATSSKHEENVSRKRGRPKGSLNKKKARREGDGPLPSELQSDFSALGLEQELAPAEQRDDTDSFEL